MLFCCNTVNPFATCHTYGALLQRHQRGAKNPGMWQLLSTSSLAPPKSQSTANNGPFVPCPITAAVNLLCAAVTLLCAAVDKTNLNPCISDNLSHFFRNILCVPPHFYSSIHLYLINIRLGHMTYFC